VLCKNESIYLFSSHPNMRSCDPQVSNPPPRIGFMGIYGIKKQSGPGMGKTTGGKGR
jgi:hypothetical protein